MLLMLNLQFPVDGDNLMEVADVVSSGFFPPFLVLNGLAGQHMAVFMDRCFVLAIFFLICIFILIDISLFISHFKEYIERAIKSLQLFMIYLKMSRARIVLLYAIANLLLAKHSIS